MLCGSHTLYPAVESTCMTSLHEYLATNKDASLSVGQWALQEIVDVLLAGKYAISNLCTRLAKVHLGNTISVRNRHYVLLSL